MVVFVKEVKLAFHALDVRDFQDLDAEARTAIRRSSALRYTFSIRLQQCDMTLPAKERQANILNMLQRRTQPDHYADPSLEWVCERFKISPTHNHEKIIVQTFFICRNA